MFVPSKTLFFLEIFHPLVIFASRAASRVAHWVRLRVVLHRSSPRCSRLWSKQSATAPEDAVGAGESHSAITLSPAARR